MQNSFSDYRRIRKSFGKIQVKASMPNLIDVQKNSYDKNFLQIGVAASERKDKGLQSVLKSIFPIQDPSGIATLEFVSYDLDAPKYDVDECIQKIMSYAAPLKVTLRIIVWDIDEENGEKHIKGIKEQEVYMGDIPLMTKNGTFIFNGTERVVVSQMHRSPGVFFDHDQGKTHLSGKYLYSARIIPYRGSWLDLEFDSKDLVYFRIDRKRKLPVSTLLYAIGMSQQEIYDFFYGSKEYKLKSLYAVSEFNTDTSTSSTIAYDLIDDDTGEVLLQAGQKITPRLIKKFAQTGLKNIRVDYNQLVGKFLAKSVFVNSEVTIDSGSEITNEMLNFLIDNKVGSIKILNVEFNNGPYLINTIKVDKAKDKESALAEIYRVIRPGEPSTPEVAQTVFNNLFFDPDRYDLSEVGRMKLNARLSIEKTDLQVLTPDDIKHIVFTLIELRDGRGYIDDIDHLGNRRVRSVGELIENQLRIGLLRIEKTILERMSSVEIDAVMPYDLINSKLLVAVIKEFFGTSQLSQFMDQTNPLSEITHKRRLSALGPGGLSRDRASFEVRDVHHTHYGRICPIETPEGQNVGLINSLATYASINKYGFIESPCRVVKDGVVTDEIIFLSAIEEGKYKIGPAGLKLDQDSKIIDEMVNCRSNGNFVMTPSTEVDFVDVTPMQVVSVAASLIPFLENDDSNRALMGSNMQRQAVPLLRSEAPLVGTGVEKVVAKDSGTSLLAIRDGVVEHVDASRIVIKNLDDKSAGVDIYSLMKFQRSNHNTCINQKPAVSIGDFVKKGDVIADGPSTDSGEIALGKNVLIAFVSWAGYNFEDSIIISERIVKDDVFSSVHIEEFEIVARDTRLGPEEITRDIPGIGDEHLKHLDEVGIVHLGADVRPGDILVGKVTPKSESPITPEEKLLRAIFGEKAADVRDSSLYTPPGVYGTVVEVRVFSRRGIEKDERSKSIELQQINKLTKDRDDELGIIQQFVSMRLKNILLNKKTLSGPKAIKAGIIITEEFLENIPHARWSEIIVDDEAAMLEIQEIKEYYEGHRNLLNEKFNSKVEKIQNGDDLPQGALKVVKVFVATKHKLQPGDKMAGRHGNKGVVSKIVPEEDMPFLEDGTIVDIILNPLGVPSRMNVGQVLETHLGWASFNLGKKIGNILDEYSNIMEIKPNILDFLRKIFKDDSIIDEISSLDDQKFIEICKGFKKGIHFATPVFDGAKVENIKEMLKLGDLDESGQVRLIDGRTGEYFDRKVTVGYKYLLKLHHLVDDKIHARSIGPYSLVTQQPLGGKSHFGGQRFGEMECWALQAYGASYTLQEMLTVKSDDVSGRIKIYESIIRGDNNFEYGIPESFNVMIKELRSLCLNIELVESNEK